MARRPSYFTNTEPYAARRAQSSGVPQGGGESWLEERPGVVAGLAGMGSYLDGLAGQKASAQDKRLGIAQYEADNAQRNFETKRADGFNRATTAAELDPLGSSQMYAGKMALIKNLMGNMAPVKSTPGDSGIAAAMGSRTPIGLPKLDPATLESLFGDLATQQSLAHRQKQIGQINPHGSSFNLSTIFGKDPGEHTENPFDSEISAFKREAGYGLRDEENASKEAVRRALEEMRKNAKGPSKLSQILGAIPSIATTILGGFGGGK